MFSSLLFSEQLFLECAFLGGDLLLHHKVSTGICLCLYYTSDLNSALSSVSFLLEEFITDGVYVIFILSPFGLKRVQVFSSFNKELKGSKKVQVFRVCLNGSLELRTFTHVYHNTDALIRDLRQI